MLSKKMMRSSAWGALLVAAILYGGLYLGFYVVTYAAKTSDAALHAANPVAVRAGLWHNESVAGVHGSARAQGQAGEVVTR